MEKDLNCINCTFIEFTRNISLSVMITSFLAFTQKRLWTSVAFANLTDVFSNGWNVLRFPSTVECASFALSLLLFFSMLG